MRLFALALLCWATAAPAQTFDMSLGGDPIGTFTVTEQTLDSAMTDSPLGVADGRFTASSRPARTADGGRVLQFLSHNSRKDRTISVLFAGDRVTETTVSPASEATALSDPAAVPAGVLDPVAAVNRIIGAGGCPAPFSYYDGRRVIAIATTDSQSQGSTTTCAVSYRVTAGPGHLSPLYISRVSMQLAYTAGKLTTMELSAGPFTLYVTRQ